MKTPIDVLAELEDRNRYRWTEIESLPVLFLNNRPELWKEFEERCLREEAMWKESDASADAVNE
jgi:hypothetical protein